MENTKPAKAGLAGRSLKYMRRENHNEIEDMGNNGEVAREFW
jgi:hypothetical protein